MAKERTLTKAPGMLPLFARAGAGMIPGASHLPMVGGARGQDVPNLVLVLDRAAIDRDRLAAYCRVCEFRFGETLPPTFMHILAFPLQLSLMTDPSFPFAAIGLVHIHNRIVVHRPVRASEPVSLRVWAEPVRPHPRGRQFSLRTEARVGEEIVWEEVSTNLRRGAGDDSAQAPDVASAEAAPTTATWRLPGDLGRRYGSVSGDLNPIHLHPLSARLFGFPAAIVHGMWTKARCLAAMEGVLPDTYTVEVAFRKPILLPARVEFGGGTPDGAWRFGVRSAEKATAHLDGILGFT